MIEISYFFSNPRHIIARLVSFRLPLMRFFDRRNNNAIQISELRVLEKTFGPSSRMSSDGVASVKKRAQFHEVRERRN